MAKILLIDDMDAVRAAIGSVLRKSGHDIVEANNGTDGLSLFQSEKPDIVITDIMMPSTDGTDVIVSLKSNSSSTPVIAISGGTSGIPAETALSIAREMADASLVKPFENEELLNTVNNLL